MRSSKLIKVVFASLALVLLTVALAGCGKETKSFESLEDFKTTPSKVAVYLGSTAEDALMENYPMVECVHINVLGDMVLNLQQGNIDAFVMDRPTINFMRKEYPELKCLDGVLTQTFFSAAFSDEFSNSEKREQYNEFIGKIKDDGTAQELQEIWFSGDMSFPEVRYEDLPNINGEISVGAATENMPYVFLSNNRITGYEIEVMRMFCEEYGYAMKCDSLSWGAMMGGIATGDYDIGIGNNMVSEKRENNVVFSEPEGDYDIVFVVLDKTLTQGKSSDPVSRFKKTVIAEERWKQLLAGMGKTLIITAGAVVFGTLLGFGIFMLCRRKNRFWCRFADIFCWIIDGFPIVVLLMFGYYVVFAAFDLNALIICIITFTFTFASGFLGMLRSAVGSIDESQMKAALGLGFSENLAFFRIILPQAVCIMKTSFISLVTQTLKGTAIVGYITVEDLTRSVDIIRSTTFDAFFPVIISAVLYFLMAWLIGRLIRPLLELFDKRRRTQAQIRKEVGDE